jgi:hypothetical protein
MQKAFKQGKPAPLPDLGKYPKKRGPPWAQPETSPVVVDDWRIPFHKEFSDQYESKKKRCTSLLDEIQELGYRLDRNDVGLIKAHLTLGPGNVQAIDKLVFVENFEEFLEKYLVYMERYLRVKRKFPVLPFWIFADAFSSVWGENHFNAKLKSLLAERLWPFADEPPPP